MAIVFIVILNFGNLDVIIMVMHGVLQAGDSVSKVGTPTREDSEGAADSEDGAVSGDQ